MVNFRNLGIFLLGAAPALANLFPLEPVRNAKKAYVSNLLRNAKPVQRRLEDAEGDYEPDITGYYLQFQKCALNTQIGACGDDGDNVCIESKKLVVFRLCKYCSSCNYDYAEYLVDLETYAATTAEYFQRVREEECNDCQEACQNDENEGDEGDEGDRRLDDCSCMDDCEAYENMEENGYIDASEYLAQCQQIGEENDDGSKYYVGPACSNDGTDISISVYSDENCAYAADVEPSDLLAQDDEGEGDGEGEGEGEGNNIQLNYDIIDLINNDFCISCLKEKEEEENDNEDENEEKEEEKETEEICEELYQAAAKCESNNGFDAGYNYYDINYDQASQEESVCDMITQLTTSYSSGSSSSSEVSRSKSATGSMSSTWKFVLGALVLLSVGLAAWALSLRSQLKNDKPDFNYEGEAMTT